MRLPSLQYKQRFAGRPKGSKDKFPRRKRMIQTEIPLCSQCSIFKTTEPHRSANCLNMHCSTSMISEGIWHSSNLLIPSIMMVTHNLNGPVVAGACGVPNQALKSCWPLVSSSNHGSGDLEECIEAINCVKADETAEPLPPDVTSWSAANDLDPFRSDWPHW